MLIEALHWWAARMADLAPSGLARRQSVWANAVIVAAGEMAGSPATLLLRRNRQEMPLGHLVPATTTPEALRAMLNGHARDHAVLLRPPRGALLEKQLVLPIAAERGLGRVIGYEMNQVTPFEQDDVFWTWTVVQHDRARGRLHVRLSLVPKSGLAALLAALERAGLAPAALEAASAAGPPRVIPLQQETQRLAWRRRARGFLAAGCGALALVAVALPFLLQSLAMSAVTDRIDAVRPQVAEVQALRKRIAAASAGQDAIAAEGLRLGNALEVLAAVTQLLPDDTFLNDLALRERQLTITGQSAAAPKLIAGFASDPRFQNPGFTAPVTRNVAGGRDVFSVSAKVGP
jgi:general secretion pathway protein L